jgi:hypothetical protein
MFTKRLFSWLLVLFLLIVAGFCVHYARGEVIDDAFISYRYCRNLLDGHGLVFNVGERVEGYTNFLWVILLSGAGWAGLDFVVASQILGALFALGTVLLLATVPQRDRPWWSRLTAPALCAANAAFCMWAVHGLETSMFGFWVLAAVYADLRAFTQERFSRWSPLFFALATLTRPEGLLLFLASLMCRLLMRPKGASFREAVAPVGIFVLIVGAHTLWRLQYYGEWFPNTFYAKTAFSSQVLARGMRYMRLFFSPGGSGLFLLLIPALLAIGRDRPISYLWCMLITALAAIVMEGGDGFPAFRFVVPFVPLLYLLVQEGLFRLAKYFQPRSGRIALLAGLFALSVFLHERHMYLDAEKESQGATTFTGIMKLAAEALKQSFPAQTTVALNAVGVIPYYTGFYTYDMLGLTDKYIARTSVPDPGKGLAGHEKGDGRYILKQKPDIILMGNVTILPSPMVSGQPVRFVAVKRSETEMIHDPDLVRFYVPDDIPVKDGRYLWFLRRKGYTDGHR